MQLLNGNPLALPWRGAALRAEPPAPSPVPCRCRGQHRGEDEAAGVCPQQKEGAGPPEPEPLPVQRPSLLVRVSGCGRARALDLTGRRAPVLPGGVGGVDVDTPEARSKHGANTRSGGRGAQRGPRACPVSEWPAGHSGAGACPLFSGSHGPFRPHKEPLQLEPWSQVFVCAPGSVRVLTPESASLCGRLPLSRGSLPSLAAPGTAGSPRVGSAS